THYRRVSFCSFLSLFVLTVGIVLIQNRCRGSCCTFVMVFFGCGTFSTFCIRGGFTSRVFCIDCLSFCCLTSCCPSFGGSNRLCGLVWLVHRSFTTYLDRKSNDDRQDNTPYPEHCQKFSKQHHWTDCFVIAKLTGNQASKDE